MYGGFRNGLRRAPFSKNRKDAGGGQDRKNLGEIQAAEYITTKQRKIELSTVIMSLGIQRQKRIVSFALENASYIFFMSSFDMEGKPRHVARFTTIHASTFLGELLGYGCCGQSFALSGNPLMLSC